MGTIMKSWMKNICILTCTLTLIATYSCSDKKNNSAQSDTEKHVDSKTQNAKNLINDFLMDTLLNSKSYTSLEFSTLDSSFTTNLDDSNYLI